MTNREFAARVLDALLESFARYEGRTNMVEVSPKRILADLREITVEAKKLIQEDA